MSILARVFGNRNNSPYFSEFNQREDDPLLDPERVRLGSNVINGSGSHARVVTGDDFASQTGSNTTRLSHLDRMTKSPFQKYKQHRRFPVKFVLNLMTVALLTTLYVVKNLQYSIYMDSNTDMIRRRFGDSDDYPQSETGETLLYTVDEVYDHMKGIMDTYYTFNETALSPYITDRSVVMTLSDASGKQKYNSTPSWPLGPFTNMSKQDLISTLQSSHFISFQLRFSNRQHADASHDTLMNVDHQWDCKLNYDLSYDNGRAEYSILISNTILRTSSPILIIISSLIIVFALPSLILTTRALLKSNQAYVYAQTQLSRPARPGSTLMWTDLDFADKLAFFNMWHFTTMFGDCLLILGCSLSFNRQLGFETDDHDSLSTADICFALGGFAVWVGVLKFFEWDSELYMLILSVKASLTRIGKFILTVSPVFMAYVMVGVACFYDHEDLFGDIFKTSRTLFAVLNGDSVLLVYQELHENADTGYVIFAQIYVYTFCVIFIVIVCNVFIFIVESGYDAALQAVYGDEEELSVFIDHRRLREILTEANRRDPDHPNMEATLTDLDLPDIDIEGSPSAARAKRLRRRSFGRSFRGADNSRSRARTMDARHIAVQDPDVGDVDEQGVAATDAAVPLNLEDPSKVQQLTHQEGHDAIDNTLLGVETEDGDLKAVLDLQRDLLEMHQHTASMLKSLSARLDGMKASKSRRGRKKQSRS
eukprot:TRINITY_DN11466_c2_g1_i1.p1 TRINITY_DN11466_c2_g1~~TRINITY_DN11466_c2_g1_i1.p1  ORF type:complete len:708 (+),score=153.54 TRINITY_DN11466_c2_g1_i1:51-2174(+)